MDRLHLAQDRYRQLSPLLLRPLDARASDQFEAWLRVFVCPLVDQLCKQSAIPAARPLVGRSSGSGYGH